MTRSKGQCYSTEEYLATFSEQDDDPELVFEGLIKPAEDGKSLLYAHETSCERWVPLRSELVDSIEHIGSQPCGDHRHALARIKFKQPDSDEHATLLSFAALQHRTSNRLLSASRLVNEPVRTTASLICPPGQHPCVDAGTGRWRCCSDT